MSKEINQWIFWVFLVVSIIEFVVVKCIAQSLAAQQSTDKLFSYVHLFYRCPFFCRERKKYYSPKKYSFLKHIQILFYVLLRFSVFLITYERYLTEFFCYPLVKLCKSSKCSEEFRKRFLLVLRMMDPSFIFDDQSEPVDFF